MANWSEKRILFSVLDWGLGHASRSVVLIDELVANQAIVFLASRGSAAQFLARRFPALPILELPDEEVRYGRAYATAALIARSFKQKRINRRQEIWTRGIVEDHAITHLISDNVYGVFHPLKPSAIVSHQLRLRSPFAERFINRELTRWLERFSEVWIPDQGGDLSLSGELSINEQLRVPQYRLGILSRFRESDSDQEPIDILAISSGVERQVSVFEAELAHILARHSGNVVLAGSGKYLKAKASSLPFKTMVGGDESLMEALSRAQFVICRSGFSSLSDLAIARKPGLIIPTPGQPEQVYLAKRAQEKGWFSAVNQGALNAEVIAKAMGEGRQMLITDRQRYAEVLRNFLVEVP